jgi:hypothetical protein
MFVLTIIAEKTYRRNESFILKITGLTIPDWGLSSGIDTKLEIPPPCMRQPKGL